MSWPVVLDEDSTLKKVLAGASIARYGDGEFNICLGRDCITQPYSKELAERLRAILMSGGDCLVAIPRVNIGPKRQFWSRFNRPEVEGLLGLQRYGSSFITRPDSAPWIDRADYWKRIQSIWTGKAVTLVRGSEKSLTKAMLRRASAVKEVLVPYRKAWNEYGRLLQEASSTEIVLLCCGPTATVLACDLCHIGHHAIDLGHVGMFLRKHLRGEPMDVTEADKAVDRHGMARRNTGFAKAPRLQARLRS